MESLFPEDMEELVIEEGELDSIENPVEYIGGIAFTDDFVRDGRNVVQSSSGIDSWKQWCMNCLVTERYASPIYSTDFGIALNDIMRAATRAESEALFKTEAIEALEADPYERTDHVGNISFEWGTDGMTAYVEVVGIDGATIDLEVPLEGR